MERTPASMAISTAGEVWQCASTYVCQLRATSTATAISALESWMLSNASVGETMPPRRQQFDLRGSATQLLAGGSPDFVDPISDDVAGHEAGDRLRRVHRLVRQTIVAVATGLRDRLT